MATIYTNKPREERPDRAVNDHYRTEQTLVDAAVRYLYKTYLERAGVRKDRILDPAAGDGRWGIALAKAARRFETLVGVDVDRKWGLEGVRDDWYTDWYTNDFIDIATLGTMPFDVVLSNPPYGPVIKGKKKLTDLFMSHGWPLADEVRSVTKSELFIRRGWDLLVPGGFMMYLLPLPMMASTDRYYGLWQDMAPIDVRVCARRPSFYNGGTDSTDYAVYIWHKKIDGKNANFQGREWKTGLLNFERSDEK